MATELRNVVKAGYEQFHAEATEKLNNIDADIEVKVNAYRETVIAEMSDDRVRLQNIIDMCTEVKEFEVPDVVEEPETETEHTEEYTEE